VIRVMIVDDHLMVRDGLKVFLSVYDDLEVVADAQDGYQAIEMCEHTHPDVILMDILMPGLDGPTSTEQIRKEYPNIQVIALTSFVEHDLVERALQSGAISYLLKDAKAEKLAQAIREAYRGRGTIDSAAAKVLVETVVSKDTPVIDLTGREKDVIRLMVYGATNSDIAEKLNISIGTVRFHVSNILSKLGVSNRTEAVSLALRQGWVD